MVNMKNPITPGEILLEEYLQPMGISQDVIARAIGVAPHTINEIVLGKHPITPAMSIRFGEFFGQSEQFWHGLQVECDFRRLSGARFIAQIMLASAVVRTFRLSATSVAFLEQRKGPLQITPTSAVASTSWLSTLSVAFLEQGRGSLQITPTSTVARPS